jgi:hypothetical protein
LLLGALLALPLALLSRKPFGNDGVKLFLSEGLGRFRRLWCCFSGFRCRNLELCWRGGLFDLYRYFLV